MSIVSKTILKSYFETGDIPTQQNFIDLIDSMVGGPASVIAFNNSLHLLPGSFVQVSLGVGERILRTFPAGVFVTSFLFDHVAQYIAPPNYTVTMDIILRNSVDTVLGTYVLQGQPPQNEISLVSGMSLINKFSSVAGFNKIIARMSVKNVAVPVDIGNVGSGDSIFSYTEQNFAGY